MDLFSKLKAGKKDPQEGLTVPCRPRRVYDIELCANLMELKQCIHSINENGWILSSVTQDIAGIYTVIFSRFAYG